MIYFKSIRFSWIERFYYEVYFKKAFANDTSYFSCCFFSFAIIEIAPGDVLMHYIRPNMTNEEIEELKEELGLNDGIVEKFCGWGKNVLKGNWGYSQINWLDGCSLDSFHCDVNSIGIDIRSE